MTTFKNLIYFSLLLTMAAPQLLLGQAGTSSMSVGVSRAGIARSGPRGQYMMPSPDMIRVEEYINYHRHELPLPKEGSRVRLDLQQLKLDNGKTVYQIGITTPRAQRAESMPPLNIVLVIDRSGSMSGDRIANVKKAIRSMIEQFRETDKITIVGFSNDARVHLEAARKTKPDKIQNALDSIKAGGGTNLYAGLMLGYQQALKHFDPERTNRVIFLTDGNANIGTTENEDIANQSKECNQRGISLSTIGLGKNFNHELLRSLADSGRGVVHFVNDSKDIRKTFISEIDSLLAPAARNVRLTLDLGKYSGTPKIYGYRPKRNDDGQFVFQLDDLNHGATQVVIARLPTTEAKPHVHATLRYVDAISNQHVKLTKDSGHLKHRKEFKASINRNYSIALVANSIKTAAEASNAGDCEKAEKRLTKGMEKARDQLDHSDDKNVDRIIDLARDYQQKIAACIARGARD